jgi:hypothetical protein
VEVQVKVTEVMDELQHLLGGSAIDLEYSWHEDEAIGVSLAELLLLSVLQVVCLESTTIRRTHGWLPSPHGWMMEIASTMWVPMFWTSLMKETIPHEAHVWGPTQRMGTHTSGMFLGKVHEEGDHFLVALVCPAIGLAAG